MILLVGLGNPGEKYKKTRHNLGFMVLDEFKKNQGFSDWKIKKKHKAEISEGNINGKKIVLVKPQTFMNESGRSVKTLLTKPGLAEGLWIVHDDLDLELDKIKIVRNRGSAGHKGVQSIINETGTKNFIRFRVGINRFAQNQKSPHQNKFGTEQAKIRNQKSDEFVLQKFNEEEYKILKEVIKETCRAIEIAIKKGVEKTMSEFNK